MGEDNRIADAFVAARRASRAIRDYPGRQPPDLRSAYAVQDEAIRLFGEEVAGWKIGRINPPLDADLGSNRLAGPIFPSRVRDARAGIPSMPVFEGGFAAAEAEFLLRIGTAPDPARRAWTIDDTASHIDAVHVGLEIASSPFAGINDLGPLVTISDFGNNHGLVIGGRVSDWQSLAFLDWPVTTFVDGAEAGRGTAAAMLDGPLGAARWLFEAMAAREVKLTAGQWISSGAVTGVHPVRIGALVDAHFDTMVVSCAIEAATPSQAGEGEVDDGSTG